MGHLHFWRTLAKVRPHIVGPCARSSRSGCHQSALRHHFVSAHLHHLRQTERATPIPRDETAIYTHIIVMPPAKSSGKGHDDKADAPTAKERSATSAKMRRNASQTSATQGRDVTSAPTSAPAQTANEPSAPTVRFFSCWQ